MSQKARLLKLIRSNSGFIHGMLNELNSGSQSPENVVTLTQLKDLIAGDHDLIVAIREEEELRLSQVKEAVYQQALKGGAQTMQALYLQTPSLFSCGLEESQELDLSALSTTEFNALQALIEKATG